MMRLIVVDSGPLGYATNPRASAINIRCSEWIIGLLASGEQVVIREIADYEVRRGWLRTRQPLAIERLNGLKATLRYEPITTEAMVLAAEFWADARQRGYATAGDQALDADVILAAQAVTLGGTVVATTNVGHLARYTQAQLWEEIT
jgi:predicted nucleic acid-binding protein